MQSKYGKFIGITLKVPENKYAKPNQFKFKTSNAKTFILDKLGKWIKSREVQDGIRQGKVIKLGLKESYDDRNPQDEKTFMDITFYLGPAPAMMRSVDGLKPIGQVVQQPVAQARPMQQPKPIINEDSEPLDDEIPF